MPSWASSRPVLLRRLGVLTAVLAVALAPLGAPQLAGAGPPATANQTAILPGPPPAPTGTAATATSPCAGTCLVPVATPAAATAAATPAAAAAVAPNTPVLTTTADPPVAVISNSTVRDVARLVPALGAPLPTGTVTFHLYSDVGCTAEVFNSTNGVGADLLNTRRADSDPFRITTAGIYHWVATYNGDINNNPVTSLCIDPLEQVAVARAQPVVSTTATPATATVGSQLRDTAVVGFGVVVTGTVTFELFSDAACTNRVFSSTNAIVPIAGTTTSDPYTVTAPGTYHWLATYNGDINNDPSIPVACNNLNEQVVVTGSASSTTTPSTTSTSTSSTSTSSSSSSTTTSSSSSTTSTSTTSSSVPTGTSSSSSSSTSSTTVTTTPTSSTTTSTTAPGTSSTTAPGTSSTTAPGASSTTVPASSSTTTPGASSTTVPGSSSTTTPGSSSTTSSTAASSSTITTQPPASSTSSTGVPPSSTTTTSTTSSTIPTGTTTSSSTSTSTSTSTTSSTTSSTTAPPSTTTPTTAAPVSTSTAPSTTAVAGLTSPSGPAAVTPRISASPQVVNPGQTTTVAGTGFPPGQPVLVQLFSDPVTLGTATADATGAFRLVVTVPSATTPGVHTLVATGPGGRPRAEAPLNVSAPTGLLGAVSQVFNLLSPALTPVQSTVTLARTGSESARATRLAGLLVALGVALVAAGWSAERATAFPARSRRRGSRRRRRRI